MHRRRRLDGNRGDPAVALVDPFAQPQAGRFEVAERLIVAQYIATLDVDVPASAVAGVVVDCLVEQRAVSTNPGYADGDARELSFRRSLVQTDIGVVALDQHHPIRCDVT